MSRKSQVVSAGLVAALAGSLVGCSDEGGEQAKPQCVKEENGEYVIVEEAMCPPLDDDDDDDGPSFMHWYYGGSHGHVGQKAHGGSTTKPSKAGSKSSKSSNSNVKSGHMGGGEAAKGTSGGGS